MSQQGNLTYALVSERGELGGDVIDGSRHLASAHVGHDAIATEVITAGHDGHPGMPRLLAPYGKIARKAVAYLERLDLGLARDDATREQIDQVPEVMRAEDDVHVGELIAQGRTLELPDASAHGDDALGVMRARHVLDRGDLTHETLLRLLAYAAGQEDGDVGFLDGEHRQRTGFLEHAGDAFGIVLVHLAAKGALPVRHARKRSSLVYLVHLVHVSFHRSLCALACSEKRAVLPFIKPVGAELGTTYRIAMPVGTAADAKAKALGNLDELGALLGRLQGMVCLQTRHALAGEAGNEVNDAIARGMGDEGVSARLRDEAHRLDGIGIDGIDIARRCRPEELAKRLVDIRDTTALDEQATEERTVRGRLHLAQVIGADGIAVLVQQIGHLVDAVGASTTILVEVGDERVVARIDEVAEHVHGAPVVARRDFHAGNELDAMLGTWQASRLEGGQGIMIGYGNGLQAIDTAGKRGNLCRTVSTVRCG